MGFQDKKAEAVRYNPPPYPYKSQQHPVLDALWWNPQTRNSISYFSSCSKAKKSLENFQKASFPEDVKYKILKSLKSKKRLYSVLEISNTNQKTYSGIYTMQKGECYFNINFVSGSQEAFKKGEVVFKTFIQGFHSK